MNPATELEIVFATGKPDRERSVRWLRELIARAEAWKAQQQQSKPGVQSAA